VVGPPRLKRSLQKPNRRDGHPFGGGTRKITDTESLVSFWTESLEQRRLLEGGISLLTRGMLAHQQRENRGWWSNKPLCAEIGREAREGRETLLEGKSMGRLVEEKLSKRKCGQKHVRRKQSPIRGKAGCIKKKGHAGLPSREGGKKIDPQKGWKNINKSSRKEERQGKTKKRAVRWEKQKLRELSKGREEGLKQIEAVRLRAQQRSIYTWGRTLHRRTKEEPEEFPQMGPAVGRYKEIRSKKIWPCTKGGGE